MIAPPRKTESVSPVYRTQNLQSAELYRNVAPGALFGARSPSKNEDLASSSASSFGLFETSQQASKIDISLNPLNVALNPGLI